MRKGLKLVALLEGSKGLVSLVVGLALHRLAGKDIQHILESITAHLHLNPASKFSGIIYQELHSITYSNLTLIAVGALAYSLLRLLEAYGLWNGLAWVEWFALLSGAVYIPFEVYEIIVNRGIFSFIVIMINIIIVWYLYIVVRSNKRRKHA